MALPILGAQATWTHPSKKKSPLSHAEIPNKEIIQKLKTDTSTKTQYPTYAVRLAWRTGSISIQNEAVD